MEYPAKETQVRGAMRAAYQSTQRLEDAEAQLKKDSENAALWEEKGHALVEIGLYREAIEAFSRGLVCDPTRGTLYLERGHRHLNCGEFEEAAADLHLASMLCPQRWDVYYHLGLAHYMLGEYDRAEDAFRFGIRLSDRDNYLVPMLNWCWVTLVHAGKQEDADALLKTVRANMKSEENYFYLNLLLLDKGIFTPEDVLFGPELQPDADSITAAYGVSNYYYFVAHDEQKSDEWIDRILAVGAEEAWATFAYLSAMTEKQRRARK